MRLTFLGANRQVTGSRYFLEAGGIGVMIDCGLVQERAFLDRNWENPPIAPDRVHTLLLTHAHLDHSGLLPRFVKQGYRRRILTTAPSIELTALVLRDSAHIQEEDAQFKIKRHEREGRTGPRPVLPLYTADDAEKVLKLLYEIDYGQPFKLNDNVSVVYHDAGHILGSAMIEVRVNEGGEQKRIVFSGDIGQWNKPLIRDPSLLDGADYVVMESTYGDRNHENVQGVEVEMARIINEAVAAGGNVVVPTFAIERAQEIIWHLGRLAAARAIPQLMVFLDSPMAVDATEMFRRYPRCLDEETKKAFASGKNPLQFPNLRLCRSPDESKAINALRGTCVIMAGSGMCNGGRIKHHLVNNIARREATVLFTGYQSVGTLGREIVDGAKQVRILGQMYPVNAKVVQLRGLSAHADHDALIKWIGHFTTKPRRVFLTHGEEEVSLGLAEEMRSKHGYDVLVPEYKQSVELA
ncbi:MAG: MBL fold metallo-hydrolase [Planctomycetes bacterium]|nr:MBL fold metallo-hydrolase [Planctomycetota bacterium]